MSKSIGRKSFNVYQPVKLLAAAFIFHAATNACQGQTTATAEMTSASAQTDLITTAPAQTAPQDEPTSVALPHGVYYQVLNPGTGPEASTTQTMLLHYDLFLTNGTKLESSREAEIPQPISLRQGQGDFIPGAEAGVKGMKLGEVRKIYIPSDQAYGEQGKPPLIWPNTPVLFTMELVNIK